MFRYKGAPKRSVHLTLNAEVLDMARELGLNLSATVDSLFSREVERLYWERWKEENRAAIAEYNDRVKREGLPLAKYRTF